MTYPPVNGSSKCLATWQFRAKLVPGTPPFVAGNLFNSYRSSLASAGVSGGWSSSLSCRELQTSLWSGTVHSPCPPVAPVCLPAWRAFCLLGLKLTQQHCITLALREDTNSFCAPSVDKGKIVCFQWQVLQSCLFLTFYYYFCWCSFWKICQLHILVGSRSVIESRWNCRVCASESSLSCASF